MVNRFSSLAILVLSTLSFSLGESSPPSGEGDVRLEESFFKTFSIDLDLEPFAEGVDFGS